MEVRTDSGTIFTSNCSHEQHTYNTQVDDALTRTSGIYCSLQTSTSARLLIDASAAVPPLPLPLLSSCSTSARAAASDASEEVVARVLVAIGASDRPGTDVRELCARPLGGGARPLRASSSPGARPLFRFPASKTYLGPHTYTERQAPSI